MAVKFKDYYETLGVSRTADAAEIRKAYRKLARQYHPDVNKNSGAESRFKEISEAHEVLSDPEKRKRYDTLGTDWKSGQEFTPPTGWENVHFGFHGSGAPHQESFDQGEVDFSDFFESLFGGGGGGGPRPGSAGRGGGRRWSSAAAGQDQESEITIALEEAYHGAKKSISLQSVEIDPMTGRPHKQVKSYEVKIPAGATDGTRIRLAGQGGTGSGGGPSGDLYIRLRIAPNDRFRLNGYDIETDLSLSPWEAALGATVSVPTMEGTASVRIPGGTQTGQRIRLKGKGMPRRRDQGRGDLFAVVKIVVPASLSAEEKKLFEQLARVSPFKPR